MTDFIHSQRERVLETENTAQMALLDILDKSLPNIDDLVIDIPLSGDLDFDVLKKCDFKNITGLVFSNGGQITSLRGIPEGITRVECPRNLLIELELPTTIEILDIQENAIENLDFSRLRNLKRVNLSFNRFHTLENLPPLLEMIVCDNNQIRRIDLAGLDNLTTLHCSNNGLLAIENMPDNVSDFVMENNPLVNIDRRRMAEALNVYDNERDSEKEESGEKKIEYLEALGEYFKMKTKYEEKSREMKRDIYEKNESKRAAKKIIAKLKVPCVNCRRPVGTVFSIKDRHYLARCGDTNENTRCMDIDIFAGEYNNIRFSAGLFTEILEINRENIIRLKLDTLFQYITEDHSLKEFKREMEEYTENAILQKEIMAKYEELFFSESRKEKIEESMARIFAIEEDMREQYLEYKQSGNTRILQTVMDIYKRDYLKEIGNLRNIKYDVLEMEPDENENEYHLVQKVAGLTRLDFTFGEEPSVIKYMKKANVKEVRKK